MANRKFADRNMRKIVRIGNASLAVTLPVGMLKSLGWKDKQKVVLKQKGRSIIIRDWKA